MINTELLEARRMAAPNDVGPGCATAAAVCLATAPDQDAWASVKTLLEIGFAIVRVVELAILFA